MSSGGGEEPEADVEEEGGDDGGREGTRVENQCELPEGRRVLCLPPRVHGG